MTDKLTRILMVDDSAIERMKLKGYLGKRGFEIIEASHGAEGVSLFIEHMPDIVLMDVNMPVMNGYEAIRRIRAHETKMVTPILMLTADDELQSIEMAFDVGANDFFPKPINFPLLHQRIRYALRDADRERDLRRVTSLQETARILAGLAFWEIDLTSYKMHWSEDSAHLLHWIKTPPVDFDESMQIIHADDRQRLINVFQDAIKTGSKIELEVRSPGKGQEYILKIVGQMDFEQHLFVGAIQDVTSQRQLEQQANYLAFHDSVTGLPTRKLFHRNLEEYIQCLDVDHFNVVVCVMEIHRFQQITETYGVETADQLLVRLITQLKSHMPADAIIGRLEGGVFALRLQVDRSTNKEQIVEVLNQWLEHLNRPWALGDRETYLTYTVGVSLAPSNSSDAGELLSMANRTQRLQKPMGNITLGFYTNDQDDSLRSRLKLESDLRVAVEQQQFYLVYQPQVDLSSEKIVGVEALLRWRHPSGETIPPFRFIPILEEIGLIRQLGDWILEEACRQQVEWQTQGYSLRMGVNLSPIQFEQQDLPSTVKAILEKTHMDAKQLKLEITESLAMHNPDATIETLHRLRQLGCKIAIDDFGIGFSSLEYLLRFPLDTLKIDRAFIKDITRGRSDRAIVRSLTSLCQGLGLTTIAEGVETQRQRDYIDALGATEIQGYLISPPVESAGLIELVDRYTLSIEASTSAIQETRP